MAKKIFWIPKKRFLPLERESSFIRIEEIDITNWQAIMFGFNMVSFGVIPGIFINANRDVTFIPTLTTKEIFDFLWNDSSFLKKFHLRGYGFDIAECFSCKGNGKLDWVSKTTKGVISRNKFFRDGSKILQYQYKFLKGEVFSPDLFISKVELNPGEEYCKNCRGSGLALDARTLFFKGFRNIKNQLIERDSEEVYKDVIEYERSGDANPINRD